MLKSTENNWMNSRLLCIKSKELIDSNPLPLFSIEKSNQFSLFYLLLLTITMLVNFFSDVPTNVLLIPVQVICSLKKLLKSGTQQLTDRHISNQQFSNWKYCPKRHLIAHYRCYATQRRGKGSRAWLQQISWIQEM